MERQLVIFEIANQNYGIDIASVEGIVKMQPIIPMPNVPGYIEGITNLRGLIIPVIDLNKLFGNQSRGRTDDTRIVVVMVGNRYVGMIVDAISEILIVDEEEIEPTPVMVMGTNSEFLMRNVKIDSRLVFLLDLEKVFSKEVKGESVQLLL